MKYYIIMIVLRLIYFRGMGSKSLRTFRERTENDFKDPEDGFWDKNNSEVTVSNSQEPVNLDIRGECLFARVQL